MHLLHKINDPLMEDDMPALVQNDKIAAMVSSPDCLLSMCGAISNMGSGGVDYICLFDQKTRTYLMPVRISVCSVQTRKKTYKCRTVFQSTLLSSGRKST